MESEEGTAERLKSKPAIKWTLLQASAEFNTTRETLRRGLMANGVEVKPNGTFTTHEIHCALAGDGKKARARKDLADAIAKERENKIAEREVIPIGEVQSTMDKVLLAVRQWMLSLPSKAHRVNPSDPAFAQAALDQIVGEGLPILRNEIQKNS